jgi:hypothetical protein
MVTREQLEGCVKSFAGHRTAVEAGRLRHHDPSAIRAHYLQKAQITHRER